MFAGAGGWDVAAEALGLSPLGIEIDADACRTREAAGLRTLQADVAALDPHAFAPCHVFLGSPPCPSFSTAGAGLGRALVDLIVRCAQGLLKGEDGRVDAREVAYGQVLPLVVAVEQERAKRRHKQVDEIRCNARARRDAEMSLLVVEPIRWIVALRPDLVALEQVPPVLPIWRAFGELLRPLGYHVWAGLLSAECFGVPQTRERAFLMASHGGPVHPPRPTHQRYEPGLPAAEQHTLEGTLLPWVSMAEALGWGMTERPTVTVQSTSGKGGPRPIDGGTRARAIVEREREREDRGSRSYRLNRGAGMLERHGERRAVPESEPAPGITSKARTAEWVSDDA